VSIRHRAFAEMTSWSDAQHGLLPPLLLALTGVTGIVDAISFLRLGHVFVANMTGNIVFLAFAIFDPQEFSVLASVIAVVAFLAGALAGGRLGFSGTSAHRARLLAWATAIEIVLVVAALVATTKVVNLDAASLAYTLIVLLAFAMGVQNATSRRLGVPDLTTTVLTLTLTGFAADSRLAGGTNLNPRRRLAAVGAMFLGAVIGAALVLRRGVQPALGLALLLLIVAAAAACGLASSTEAWATRGK
jgi:uncharacterized membrane protein YoaK (UPF0700 family)